MSWVKLRDNWIESERVEDIGPEALALHISALSYSARNETDGRVPRRALRRLYTVDDIDLCVKKLVDSGLGHALGDDFGIDGWQGHLLSSAEMKKRREQSATSSERYRRHQLGDHSMCDRCWAKRKTRDDVTDAGSDDSSDAPRSATSRIASSRSVAVAEERDENGRASSASAPHARPPRARAGRLYQLDAAMLDELPWRDIGTGCPHDADGWAWVDDTKTRLAGVRCERCMQLVRNTGQRASDLARTSFVGFNDAAAWIASFEYDPELTSAALCLASLICSHVDGVETSERADAVATEIVRRHPSEPMYEIKRIFKGKAP